MIALGLDIGGTKIEAQSFAKDWSLIDRRRVATPADYSDFIQAVCWQVDQMGGGGDSTLPIGISIAGFSNPVTGEFVAANLPASRKPLLADIESSLGRRVKLINDARAFTQSEAVFGVAKTERIVAGIILGTGVGGGVVIDRQIHSGPYSVAGEFGHTSVPGNILVESGLPLLQCGCGRLGCIETLASGPGLSRICAALTGQELTPEEIAAKRRTSAPIKEAWHVWCQLLAELMLSISLCVEPEVFVLGGGVSKIPGIADDLFEALASRHVVEGAKIAVRLAEGGDASGARGAAYAAWHAQDWGAEAGSCR